MGWADKVARRRSYALQQPTTKEVAVDRLTHTAVYILIFSYFKLFRIQNFLYSNFFVFKFKFIIVRILLYSSFFRIQIFVLRPLNRIQLFVLKPFNRWSDQYSNVPTRLVDGLRTVC